ncbi:hypothetical protein FRC16_011517 [Serendipita sp. 398]|nr:hypothetical protein FRC16_011517 [Serendipita sp. 398]
MSHPRRTQPSQSKRAVPMNKRNREDARNAYNFKKNDAQAKTFRGSRKGSSLLERGRSNTQNKTASVEKSIAQRLPVDILSLIILEYTQANWEAPLALSQVCHLWRVAALSTPAAWSYLQIDPYDPPRPEFLKIWLSRCRAVTCRLSFAPWASFALVKAACDKAEVLKGLSIFDGTQVLTGSFPNLEELRLGTYSQSPPREWKRDSGLFMNIGESWATKSRSSLLDATRFPSLKTLHLHSPISIVTKAITQPSNFPPLQELHIHASDDNWVEIIRLCADSLVKLGIHYDGGRPIKPANLDPLTLPNLKSLSLVAFGFPEGTIDHDLAIFKTPSLERYYESQRIFSSPIHSDTLSVTSATFSDAHNIDWARLPRITHVALHAGEEECLDACRALEKHSPNLHEIQCILDYGPIDDSIQEVVQSRSNTTGKTIHLRIVPREDYKFPQTSYQECFTCLPGTCGEHYGDVFNERKVWLELTFGHEFEELLDGSFLDTTWNHWDPLTGQYSMRTYVDDTSDDYWWDE